MCEVKCTSVVRAFSVVFKLFVFVFVVAPVHDLFLDRVRTLVCPDHALVRSVTRKTG